MQAVPIRRVGILAYDGLCLFEFGCAIELFALPRPELERWYDTSVLALEPGPLRATADTATVQAGNDLSLIDRIDMLVVPGWSDIELTPPAELLDRLRDLHGRGGRLVSFCSGAFALAASGLLDGRPATTHWRYTDRFRQRFPRVRLVDNVLYTDQDNLCTSAGSAAGLDLGLHLIRKDFGPLIANKVAKRLVIPAHREGGQTQYVDRPLRAYPGRLAATLDWALERLDRPLTIAALAGHACVSRRSFDRQFRAAMGVSPKQWLNQQRVRLARDYLETTTLSVDAVAAETGFGSAMNLRHHFRQQLGTSPQRYRRQFARLTT